MRHGEVARGGRRHPHILFGGKGGPRLAALVARYGDEFNLNSASPDDAPAAIGRVRAACEAIGRDPDEVVYSAMTGVLVAETEDDLRTRVADLLAGSARPTRTAASGWPSGGSAGSWERPTRRAERVSALERTGLERIMLQDFVPRDLDHVRLIGRVFAG